MSTRVKLTNRGRAVIGTFATGMGLGLALSFQPGMVAFASGGPNSGAVLGQAALPDLEFRVQARRFFGFDGAQLHLGDQDVTSHAEIQDGRVVYRPEGLDDGSYTLVLTVDGGFPFGGASQQWDFTIDTAPPELVVTEPDAVVEPDAPMTIAGTVDPDATLLADGAEVPVQEGRFTIAMDTPPEAPVVFTATDPLGNTTEQAFTVDVARARPDEVRSVHMTAYAWVTPSLRDPILQMIAEGKINSVELDLKDESGDVGYDSQVPLAQEIGAAKGIYDLEAALDQLHALDVHVIGRIVAFRDPVLGDAMWERGERDQVLQTPDGSRYAGYGGFTNFAHPAVRQYNIDIAVEAAAAGIDDILYDYIRRPDGKLENLVIPGLEDSCGEPGACTPENAIVSFLADSREQLAPYRVWHGASVYGIASDRPTEIAQDIPGMAAHTDYIAPMVYPSHWARGEYDVADPNSQPYDIVHRSVAHFLEVVEGTETRIVPWLQDFSLGVSYGPAEVRAQIDAARDAGTNEWILWSPSARYTTEALDPAG